MLSKNQNHIKRQGTTRLAAIRVTEIDDSLEVSLDLSANNDIVVRKLHSRWWDTHHPDAWKKFMRTLDLHVS